MLPGTGWSSLKRLRFIANIRRIRSESQKVRKGGYEQKRGGSSPFWAWRAAVGGV